MLIKCTSRILKGSVLSGILLVMLMRLCTIEIKKVRVSMLPRMCGENLPAVHDESERVVHCVADGRADHGVDDSACDGRADHDASATAYDDNVLSYHDVAVIVCVEDSGDIVGGRSSNGTCVCVGCDHFAMMWMAVPRLVVAICSEGNRTLERAACCSCFG